MRRGIGRCQLQLQGCERAKRAAVCCLGERLTGGVYFVISRHGAALPAGEGLVLDLISFHIGVWHPLPKPEADRYWTWGADEGRLWGHAEGNACVCGGFELRMSP